MKKHYWFIILFYIISISSMTIYLVKRIDVFYFIGFAFLFIASVISLVKQLKIRKSKKSERN